MATFPRRFSNGLLWPSLLLIAALVFAASQREEQRPIRDQPLQWGLYQILWSKSYGEHLRKGIAKFSTSPDYVMFYRDLGRPFPKRPIDAIHSIGATPMVSLELWSWHGQHKGSYLPLIIRGDYDDFLRDWARSAHKDGRRVLLRFGFEFNGDWFTWSHDPTAYISAWRHAHAIFRNEHADNVEWVWSPNIVSCPDTRENRMHRYYPGDAFVNWVSLDGYNFGDHHDKWHHWESFEKIFHGPLRDFEKRYPSKPVILSEFGCAPGKGKQRERWIREAHATLNRYPQVKAVIWFNLDKRREKEPDWRIDVTSDSLRVFNETFAAENGSPPAR